MNEIQERLQDAELGQSPAELMAIVAASQAYAGAKPAVAAWQVVSTLAAYVALLWAVHAAGAASWRYWLCLPLGGVIVRIFVLQHDCGHSSLFGSKRTNDRVGRLLSGFTGIPYHIWRMQHAWHHGHQAKLTSRGIDIYTSPMTVAEAREQPAKARLISRVVSPIAIFLAGAIGILLTHKSYKGFFFALKAFRWPVPNRPALVRSVWLTNLGHAAWVACLVGALGGWNVLAVFVPAMIVAASLGGHIFWVQHNFEDTYMAPDETWSFVRAGLQGSSYVWMPPGLGWFTAHIGVHHVHHVNTRIPNYRLEEARRGVPAFAAVKPMTLVGYWRCFRCLFWDEERQRLVSLATLESQP